MQRQQPFFTQNDWIGFWTLGNLIHSSQLDVLGFATSSANEPCKQKYGFLAEDRKVSSPSFPPPPLPFSPLSFWLEKEQRFSEVLNSAACSLDFVHWDWFRASFFVKRLGLAEQLLRFPMLPKPATTDTSPAVLAPSWFGVTTIIQGALPNPATGLGFDWCIGASVCVCVCAYVHYCERSCRLLLVQRIWFKQKSRLEFQGISTKEWGPMITSGLGVSWVLVPLGPWPLERGRRQGGILLGVTPCARSAVADSSQFLFFSLSILLT